MSEKAGTVDEHQLAVALTFDFEYDSSQFAADRPYWIEENGKRTNLVVIPIAVELTDSCHFMFLFQPIVLPELSTASKVEVLGGTVLDGIRYNASTANFSAELESLNAKVGQAIDSAV